MGKRLYRRGVELLSLGRREMGEILDLALDLYGPGVRVVIVQDLRRRLVVRTAERFAEVISAEGLWAPEIDRLGLDPRAAALFCHLAASPGEWFVPSTLATQMHPHLYDMGVVFCPHGADDQLAESADLAEALWPGERLRSYTGSELALGRTRVALASLVRLSLIRRHTTNGMAKYRSNRSSS